MTEDEMKLVCKSLATKSAKIRALAQCGATRSQIASYLNIRYQHVRNVLVAPSPAAKAGVATITVGAHPGTRPLSIEEAKRGLAAQFGIEPDAIEIIIRG